ncbi:uncharacterized protein LOC141588158 [Silene latifolia]|uniref:uncharacterized protein LOC141588158 n=1 Tax=Silene latifolia TaxID=37657 RepID=UPI003D788FE6
MGRSHDEGVGDEGMRRANDGLLGDMGNAKQGVFDGVRWSVDDVLRRVRELIDEMKGSVVGEEVVREEETQKWQKPKTGWVKINVDAGRMEGVGLGLGAVCRDDEGRVMWGVTVQKEEVRERAMLKAEAVLMGLHEAKNMELMKVVIESDCLTMIEDLRKRKRGRSDLCLIYDDIYSLCTHFNTVEFIYVRRSSNRVAHELAHVRPWSLGRRI